MWKQPTLQPPLTDNYNENQKRWSNPIFLPVKEDNQNLLTESKIKRHHSEHDVLFVPSK